MKNFLRRIFSEERVLEYSKISQEKLNRLKEEDEKLNQKIDDLKQEIKKLDLTDEVSKAIKEIEILKGILANELKREKGLKTRLSEFFSISLYMYSKQLSKLTRALLILTTILIILAIIQIIIVLT